MSDQVLQALIFFGGIVVAIIGYLIKEKIKTLESAGKNKREKPADIDVMALRIAIERAVNLAERHHEDMREIKEDAKILSSVSRKLDTLKEEQIRLKASLEAAWIALDALKGKRA